MDKFKIVVLVKQVPDTRHVGKDGMKADGTINRAALPAIFNPDDLLALEQALSIKDKYPKTCITLLTMGPPRAANILREGLFRGADKAYLLTDKRFAGSDTLATSYALSLAVNKLAPFDIVFTGRQAIDGDTAQVGPQTAEKLSIPQVTLAEELLDIDSKSVTIKRIIANGIETVKAKLPVLITVTDSATPCRSRNAKRYMRYKYARTGSELIKESADFQKIIETRPYLIINEWSVDDLNADPLWLGLGGSPTKVKKVENVVLAAKDSKVLDNDETQINDLIQELMNNHTIG